MNDITKLISLDREDMTDLEKQLFLGDLKAVADEYFEAERDVHLELTRSEEGFIVCVIFNARRIKTIRGPQ